MRNSSTKSNCHHRMNRHPVGSSVRSSGEGVWALSCYLLANFTPSDEPTPSRLIPSVHPVLKEFLPSSQTRAQLLRRVKNTVRRTIRCLVSPRSSVAPTVRPTLVFCTVSSSDAPLKRGSYLSYPSAAPPTILTLTRAARSCPRRPPPVRRPSPSPATIRASVPLRRS
jgi:hypothetical protein